MKLVSLSLAVCIGLAGGAVMAAPFINAVQFNCEYKPRTNGNWEARGEVTAEMQNDGLRLFFNSSGNGSALDSIQTTNADSEYKVEARCPGQITLKNDKPFRIRNFRFDVDADNAEIGATDGLIELTAAGITFDANAMNSKDDFNKVWTVKKTELDRYKNEPNSNNKARINPFSDKQESKTICSNALTIRFNDLRGIAVRNQTSNQNDRLSTFYSVQNLFISFDPC